MVTRDITLATVTAVEPEMMEGMDEEMEMAPEMEARRNAPKRGPGTRRSPLRSGMRLNFKFPAAALIRGHGLKTAEEIIDHFATQCLSVTLPQATRDELWAHLNQDLIGDASPFDPNRWDTSRRVKGMLHLFFSTPEYQMN
jgi:hypothetical protein